MRLCQEAIERGVFAQAIRPPTVAPGSSRLRVTAIASHTHTELEMAAEVFGTAARRAGLEPAALQPAAAERAERVEDDIEIAAEAALTAPVWLSTEPERTARLAQPAPFDHDATAVFDVEHDRVVAEELAGTQAA
jgi:hypothetical protein